MLIMVAEETVAILVVDLLACVASKVRLSTEDFAAAGLTDDPKLPKDERVKELFLDDDEARGSEGAGGAEDPPLKVSPCLGVT